MSLPTITPCKRRIGRGRAGRAVATPLPSGPLLVAASMDVDGGLLTLRFDRAIDISAYDGSTVSVFVLPTHALYLADQEIQQVNATTMQATLDYQGPGSGTGTALTAIEPTGIVAVDGGIAWAGCVNLLLPFP